MIQDTAARVRAGDFLDPLIIGSGRHGVQIQAQMAQIGVSPAGVILEPFGRNTAAVGVMAAAWAASHAPDALVLLMPADHIISDQEGFRDAVSSAARTAKDYVVTFGIEPTGPETGYGYIQSGEPIDERTHHVRRFVEKPERTVAEAYLSEGGYTWNAGIFLFNPPVLLAEAESLCPQVVESVQTALERAITTDVGLLLDAESFARCPSEAIDTAIMEKTDRGAVMPISVGWADIGSWSELWRFGAAHDRANHTRGGVAVFDTVGSLLWSDGPAISVMGLSDIVVIAAENHVLVLPKSRAQDVKKIVEHWKAKL